MNFPSPFAGMYGGCFGVTTGGLDGAVSAEGLEVAGESGVSAASGFFPDIDPQASIAPAPSATSSTSDTVRMIAPRTRLRRAPSNSRSRSAARLPRGWGA